MIGTRAPGHRPGLRYPAALLTMGAAAIHFSVAPEHLQVYLPFGILFILVGGVQAALAVATVVRPGRKVYVAAVLLAVGCLAVWAVSRTAGLPIGPAPGRPEAMEVPDLVTAVFEVLSIVFYGVLLARGRRPGRSGRRWLAGSIPMAVVVTAVTSAGVSAGMNPLPYAINMSSSATGPGVTPLAMLTQPPGQEPVRSYTLTARVVRLHGAEAWTYNGTVPGPELRAMVGDRLRVTLVNDLPASTSIHWHGLRLPNADDGVAGLTQQAVPPGGTYTYEFVVRDPGTYWYHSHQDTENQVPRGLYGALVVEPAGAPVYDRDYTVIVGDSNTEADAPRLSAEPGELVRLRIISAIAEDMNGTPELLALLGAPYRVVALDGHDLNEPQELGPELLPVGTGQRCDLAFRMPVAGQVSLRDLRPQSGGRLPQRLWATLGEGGAPELPAGALPRFDRSSPLQYAGSSLPTFDLTTYGTPAPDPVADRAAFDVSRDLRISNQLGFRYGSQIPKVWEFIHMFNGRSFPDTEPIIVREGQYVRLQLVNATDEYHPIHLHGHYFSVLSKNGRRISGSPVHLDSVLIGPHETWDVAFLADNPGLWMLHCHVLIHAAYGLSTMVSYQGISTPYTIGTRDGNFPE
ncbi:MAG TPA: multicopper oxidase family protein [Candidatus Dormibacteraeota bacterium]|nr:multicopper oxidase family protein [Candidatus Dormibacteraeota bacterium]